MASNDPSEETNGVDFVDSEIRKAMSNMLPITSKEAYKKAYAKLQAWRQEKHLEGPTTEKQVFAYLYHQLESGKWTSPGTLWCQFSMLKTMMLSEEGFDMKTTDVNTTIQTWLKRLMATHSIKQAHMFTKEQVKHFIENVPDGLLDLKVILMVGVYMGLWCDSIAQLEWRHICLSSQQVELFVDYESKTDQGATGTWFAFPRRADNPALDALLLFNKYRAKIGKKDKELLNGRLWLRILPAKTKGGKEQVTRQVRGREWIGTVPKRIAEWLGLPEAAKYTGHSFWWTCAQWAADSGMTEVQMQHHFGWRSSAMISRCRASFRSLCLGDVSP
jgi:hypothetical protein